MTVYVYTCPTLPASSAASACGATAEWKTVEEITSPENLGITSEAIGQATGVGFGIVLTGWVIGYALGVALGLIKKA